MKEFFDTVLAFLNKYADANFTIGFFVGYILANIFVIWQDKIWQDRPYKKYKIHDVYQSDNMVKVHKIEQKLIELEKLRKNQ